MCYGYASRHNHSTLFFCILSTITTRLNLVHITVPKSREYINVSCRENGMEIYHKRFSVKGRKGQLFELQIPKNYRYSSKPY